MRSSDSCCGGTVLNAPSTKEFRIPAEQDLLFALGAFRYNRCGSRRPNAMRVLITGAAGLFGNGLTQIFVSEHIVFPVTHAVADTTNAAAIRDLFVKLEPEIVIHAAAIADPDTCENDPALAFSVNVE